MGEKHSLDGLCKIEILFILGRQKTANLLNFIFGQSENQLDKCILKDV